MSLILQKRDIQILKHVYAYRAVCVDQICERYFSKAFRTVGPRRIRKLILDGFLGSFVTGDLANIHRYVQLTEKGWKVIREHWDYEIDSPHFKSESPIHDLRLAYVAASFERLSTFKNIFTENLLQSSKALSDDDRLKALSVLQADGALVLSPPNAQLYFYGLEMEISKKNPERYREKLLNYYMAKNIDGVLYVSDSQMILDAVARADAEIRSKRVSILHLALEKNVLSSVGRIHFEKADGGSIELF